MRHPKNRTRPARTLRLSARGAQWVTPSRRIVHEPAQTAAEAAAEQAARLQSLRQIAAHLPYPLRWDEGGFTAELPGPHGPLNYRVQVRTGRGAFSLSGPGRDQFYGSAASVRRALNTLARADWWPRRAMIPPGDMYCYQPGTDAPLSVIATGPALNPHAPRDASGAALIEVPGLCPHLSIDPQARGGLGRGHCRLTGERDESDFDLLMDLVRSPRCPGRTPDAAEAGGTETQEADTPVNPN